MQCGMQTKNLHEYHPYAACLMYMTVHDPAVVRANLNAVVEYGKSKAKRTTAEPEFCQVIKVMSEDCTWTYSGDDYSSWDTTCGRMFCMTEDTPKKNDYNYCPGCGGRLIEVMPIDPPDEDSEASDAGVK